MAKAGRVPGIRPKETLAENAARVIAFRLEELLSWRAALGNAEAVSDLHNMRIAAKRLRYALEAFEPCFPGTAPVLKDLTDIQEDLGTIHDLDVLGDLLLERVHALEAPLTGQITEVMAGEGTPGEKNRRIRALLGAQARDARRVGLYALAGEKIAERRRRFARFAGRWDGERLDEFAGRVQHLIEPEAVTEAVDHPASA
jgi:hypothetical protein